MLSLEAPELLRRGMRGGGGGTHQQRCDSCRSAPCAVYCRADAASLCAACDADVHAANPLARRHRCVPMMVGGGGVNTAGGAFVVRPGGSAANSSSWPIREGRRCEEDDDEEEETPWLLLDPLKGAAEEALPPFGDALVGDCFLDLGGGEKEEEEEEDASSKECSSSHGKSSEASHEFPVPRAGEPPELQISFSGEMAYDAANSGHGAYGYHHGATLGHTVPVPSLDTGMVPDCTAAPDIPSSFLQCNNGDPSAVAGASAHMSLQLMAMDREARLHRYREKRKTRRFEKTIRYESRKAYAETRPRIKGRFAKRTDADVEVDQYFAAAAMADSSCGVVPSF